MSTMNLKISIAPARANMKVTFGSGANAAAYLETLVATIARGPQGPQGPQGEGIQGPRGIQGPQGETAVANINFRGPYVPGTPYYHADVNGDTDVVRSPLDGNTYYCLVDNTGNEPSTSPTYWTLFVMQGGRGEQGEQGDKGDKGDRGPAGESIPKKAVMMFAGGADEVPEGFWLCNGDDVPGYGRVPDLRSRFVVGLDPRATDYNAIGKIGGLKDVTLTMGQMPIHDHHNAAFNQLLWKDPSGNSTSYKTDRTVGEVDILHSATILSAGNNEAHENRPPYYTLAFIIRVSDPVVVLSGIESVVAGTNVVIDVTDPKNPIINVPVVNGEDGRGIVSNVKTGTVGLVDTYTTTYTDGTTDMYTVTNGTPGTTLTADQLQIINIVPLVCSDEKTDLTASTDVPVIRFVFQTAQSFTKIVGELNTAAAGGTFTVVAKKNGVSFLSTPLTFDGGENTTRTASVPFVFTTPTVSFSVGDYVEIFITAIGAVTPGKGLKIYLM